MGTPVPNAVETVAQGLCHSPAKATFARPADTTAYSIGDLVANNVTAGSVVPLSFAGAGITGTGTGTGVIDGVLIGKTGSATASLRAHFFKTSPLVTNGDNGALVISAWDLDNYIGYVDVAVTDLINGGAMGCTMNAGLQYGVLTDTIYCLLEATAAFTPSSASVFDVKLKLKRFS